jgi:radical SAM superfamily enzyme YgiQ (UPF0313 family)
MRAAGCWQIAYGIESGDNEILHSIKKVITVDQVNQALQWTKEAGIRVKAFFMVGHLQDTHETIQKTLKFIMKLPIDDFQITNYTPFPGTEDYRRAHEYGWFDDDWRKMNMLKVCFVPKGLTKEDLLFYQSKALRDFYLRPRIIWSYMKMCLKHPENVMKLVQGAVALLLTMLYQKKSSRLRTLYETKFYS